MSKRQSTINRVKALMEKTIQNGCSEAEALAASEMVAKLMADYNINTTELEFKAESFIQGEFKTESKVAGPLHFIVSAIAFFTDTKIWTSRGNTLSYKFYGAENDVRVAEFMCSMMLMAMKSELELYKKSASYKAESKFINGRTLMTSFKNGMSSRLSKRITDLKNQANQASVKETGIVPFNKMAIVEANFSKLAIKLSSRVVRSSIKSSSAHALGVVAADKVHITTGKQVKSNQFLLN